jgi:hypothetical protein
MQIDKLFSIGHNLAYKDRKTQKHYKVLLENDEAKWFWMESM